jgi:hypothetical protein
VACGLIFVMIGILFIKFGSKLDRNKNGKEIGLIFAIKPEFLGWIFVIFASFGKVGTEIKSIA